MASDLFVLPLRDSPQKAKLEEAKPVTETPTAIEPVAEALPEPVTEEVKPVIATFQNHCIARRRSSSITGGYGYRREDREAQELWFL